MTDSAPLRQVVWRQSCKVVSSPVVLIEKSTKDVRVQGYEDIDVKGNISISIAIFEVFNQQKRVLELMAGFCESHCKYDIILISYHFLSHVPNSLG